MNYFRCGGGRSTHTATKITVAKTPLATFQSNVSGLYLPEIIAYIQATQSGSGDPSPINPRTINGVDSVSVASVSDSTKLQYFQGLLYGTYAFVDMGSLNWSYVNSRFNVSFSQAKMPPNTSTAFNGICDVYTVSSSLGLADKGICITSGGLLRVYDSDYSDATTFQNAMSGHYLIYELATATAPTITTAQFEALCTAFGINGTTATTALGGTYYGCYLNVPTGLLTVTHVLFQLTGSADENYILQGDGTTARRFRLENALSDYSTLIACSHDLIATNNNNVWGYARFVSSYLVLLDNNNTMADQTALKAWLASEHTNGRTVSFLMRLATPQTVQLTPAQIEQLLGQNNVFCSSGDVAVKYWKID